MPPGAISYCTRLTWLWFWFLLALTLINATLLTLQVSGYSCPRVSVAQICLLPLIPLLLFAEKKYRNHHFTVTFHTSGSTGKSKTIVKPFECLAKEVVYHSSYLPPFDLIVHTVDPEHMLGMLWVRLLSQLRHVPTQRIATLEELEGTGTSAPGRYLLVTTPSWLKVAVRSGIGPYQVGRDPRGTPVEIVTSGSALDDETADLVEQQFGVRPLQIYGSTETGGIASMRSGLPTFFPMVKVVRGGQGRGHSCPRVSEAQRLTVRSPFSYPHTYTLGDAVEFVDRTHFKLLGRVDRMVKIREERVNLAEMEVKVAAALQCDCALIDLGGLLGCVIGHVEVERWRKPLELRKVLLPIFPKGTVPKHFRFVDELPRNSQGKVTYEAIRALF